MGDRDSLFTIFKTHCFITYLDVTKFLYIIASKQATLILIKLKLLMGRLQPKLVQCLAIETKGSTVSRNSGQGQNNYLQQQLSFLQKGSFRGCCYNFLDLGKVHG